MEIFKNKFLVKLIATICLFLTLLSYGSVSNANKFDEATGADTQEKEEQQVTGSILIKPIINLLTGIADAIMEILHSSIQEQRQSIIRLDGSSDAKRGWALFGAIVVGILAGVAFIAACVVTGGAIAAAAAAIGVKAVFTITLSKILLAAVAGIIAGTMVYKSWIPDDIYLPTFSITAEEIFANEIHLFDINFFNPKPPKEIVKTKVEKPNGENKAFIHVFVNVGDDCTGQGIWNDKNFTDGITEDGSNNGLKYKNIYSQWDIEDYTDYFPVIKDVPEFVRDRNSIPLTELYKLMDEGDDGVKSKKLQSIIDTANSSLDAAGYKKITDNMHILAANNEVVGLWDSSFIEMTGISQTTVEIMGTKNIYLAGKLFFKAPSVSNSKTPQNTIIVYGLRQIVEKEVEESTILHSTAAQLQSVIAEWYFILRNLALLVLMIVLIYSGIRIVIGSTAGEKAKYKERLKDWLVALCLIFFMHYIMLFAIEIVDRITELVRSSTGLNANAAVIELTENQQENAKKIIESDEYDISNIGALDRKYINMENRFSRTV